MGGRVCTVLSFVFSRRTDQRRLADKGDKVKKRKPCRHVMKVIEKLPNGGYVSKCAKCPFKREVNR